MDALTKKLDIIKRLGMFPRVVPAPREAVTFDKIIIVYLDEACKRLYQVILYNSKDGTTKEIR